MVCSDRQRQVDSEAVALSPRHLQRGVSFLWILLAVPTAWTSTGWLSWAAAAAYLVSFLATWLPARWATWAWAIACLLGLVFTLPERWAASPTIEEFGRRRLEVLLEEPTRL